jgi:hypothetical protein
MREGCIVPREKNSQEAGMDQSNQSWRGKREKKVLEALRKKMKICCCIE